MGTIQNQLNSALGAVARVKVGKGIIQGAKDIKDIKTMTEEKTDEDLEREAAEQSLREFAEETELKAEADKEHQMKHLGVVVNDPMESGKYMGDWSEHGYHVGGFGKGAISKEEASKLFTDLSWDKPNPALAQSVNVDRSQLAKNIVAYQKRLASASKIASKKRLMQLKETIAGGKK